MLTHPRQRLQIDPYYQAPPRSLIRSKLISVPYNCAGASSSDTERDSPAGSDSPFSSVSASPSFSHSPPFDMAHSNSSSATGSSIYNMHTPSSSIPSSISSAGVESTVLCLYDFDSNDPDHLPFRKNELLEVVKKEPSGWWAALRAHDDTPRIGWVPSAFVVEISSTMADILRSVSEEMRVFEYEGNLSAIFYEAGETTASSVSDGSLLESIENDKERAPPFVQLLSPSGLVDDDDDRSLDRDFPDDVASFPMPPLYKGQGIAPPPRSFSLPTLHPNSESDISQAHGQPYSHPHTHPYARAAWTSESDYRYESTPQQHQQDHRRDHAPAAVEGWEEHTEEGREVEDRWTGSEGQINYPNESATRARSLSSQQQPPETPLQYPPSPATPMPVPTPPARTVNTATATTTTPLPPNRDKPTPPTPTPSVSFDPSVPAALAPASSSYPSSNPPDSSVSPSASNSTSTFTSPSLSASTSMLPFQYRPTLNRSRSDSAPSSTSTTRASRRRPLMLNDYSSLSRLSVLYSPSRNDASASDVPTPPLHSSSVERRMGELDLDLLDDDDAWLYESGYSGDLSPGGSKRSPTSRRADKVRQLTGDDDAQAFHNAKLAQARLPWYLQPSYSADEIKLEYDGSVRAGTLAALVERLTVDPLKLSQETQYRHAFLTTFHTFASASEIFDLLVERYEMNHPEGLTAEEFDEWREKKHRPVQKRVLAIFNMWLEEHALLQDDPQIVPRLRDFLSLITSPPSLALTAKQMLQIIDKMINPRPSTPASAAVSTPVKRRKPSRNQKNDLLRQDPSDIAQQLTLMEHRSYVKIGPQECLRWTKSQTGDLVANLSTFCAIHDKIAAWVKMSVLLHEGLGKRADTVDLWIKVAEKCRALNNFSSTSAIVAGLSSSVIGRLQLTWAHVNRGNHLEPLINLNEPRSNFATYRAAYAVVEGPCTPFVGIFLTDIVHIQDQLKDRVSFPIPPQSLASASSGSSSSSHHPSASTSDDSGASNSSSAILAKPAFGPLLINFVKRQKWYDAVNGIIKHQSKPYQIVENPGTMTFIKEQLTLASSKEESWFWARSAELQKAEVAHADIRRGLEAAGF